MGWLTQALCCWKSFMVAILLQHIVPCINLWHSQESRWCSQSCNFGMVFMLPFLRFNGALCPRCFPLHCRGLALAAQSPVEIPYHFDVGALKETYQDRPSFQFLGESLYFHLDCN